MMDEIAQEWRDMRFRKKILVILVIILLLIVIPAFIIGSVATGISYCLHHIKKRRSANKTTKKFMAGEGQAITFEDDHAFNTSGKFVLLDDKGVRTLRKKQYYPTICAWRLKDGTALINTNYTETFIKFENTPNILFINSELLWTIFRKNIKDPKKITIMMI